jgi:hypothetical protein
MSNQLIETPIDLSQFVKGPLYHIAKIIGSPMASIFMLVLLLINDEIDELEDILILLISYNRSNGQQRYFLMN